MCDDEITALTTKLIVAKNLMQPQVPLCCIFCGHKLVALAAEATKILRDGQTGCSGKAGGGALIKRQGQWIIFGSGTDEPKLLIAVHIDIEIKKDRLGAALNILVNSHPTVHQTDIFWLRNICSGTGGKKPTTVL